MPICIYQGKIHWFWYHTGSIVNVYDISLWVVQRMLYVINYMEVNTIYNHSKGTWWRHQMETYSSLQAICAGNSPVTGEFPAQRPVTRGFDVSGINSWVNNREAGDLRRHRAHYDVIVKDKTGSPAPLSRISHMGTLFITLLIKTLH